MVKLNDVRRVPRFSATRRLDASLEDVKMVGVWDPLSEIADFVFEIKSIVDDEQFRNVLQSGIKYSQARLNMELKVFQELVQIKQEFLKDVSRQL